MSGRASLRQGYQEGLWLDDHLIETVNTVFKIMLSPGSVYQQACFMVLRARFMMTAFRRKRN